MPPLYERLGGVFAIATVVDDFIDRIMHDARLNANPKVDEAHHKVPPAGFSAVMRPCLSVVAFLAVSSAAVGQTEGPRSWPANFAVPKEMETAPEPWSDPEETTVCYPSFSPCAFRARKRIIGIRWHEQQPLGNSYGVR